MTSTKARTHFWVRQGSKFACRGRDMNNYQRSIPQPSFYINMYFFERERSWSPISGISTNLIRNNIFLTRVPKIIDVMFLLENPPAGPLSRLFRVTVMWRLHADWRWTVLLVHLFYVIPSLGLVNFKSYPAFIWEILNKTGNPRLSFLFWLVEIYLLREWKIKNADWLH